MQLGVCRATGGYIYVYLFRHVLTLLLCVGSGVWWVAGGGFTSCLITGFSWHGKKKEKPTELDTSTGFVPRSLRATDA